MASRSHLAALDLQPTQISLTIRALLSLPYRLCNPPPAVGKVRSCKVTPLFEVKLEDVINRKHLPPLGLKDFEEWLLFVEGSPENLYFMLWLREYTARYIQWEAGADLKSPPAPSPTSPTNYRFSTPRVPDSALSLFYARAKQTFFIPNADYELNVPSDILARFHSHYAYPPYPHPHEFQEVAWEVHRMLQESLDRFVVAAYQNVGTNRALCGILGGVTISLLGSIAPIAVNFADARSRWLRLTALPGLWLGLTVLLASLHGVCMMVYVFGDLRQLRKFELARPRISAPKVHIHSERISRPIRPSLSHSRSATSIPATVASFTPTRSVPPIPADRPPVPQLKLDIPAPPPVVPAPPSSSSHTASAFASVSTPYRYNRSTSSLASSGSGTDILTDKHEHDNAHAVTISDAYYDTDPAPEGPATRTGPGAALPLPTAFGGAYKFGNPDPRYHTRECRANRACRISKTAGFIHPYDSVDALDAHEFRAARATSALEHGLGLPFGTGVGDGDEFDFDALPARGFGPGWDSDDGASCVCPMTPAIASSVALPSTRPQSSQAQTAPSFLSPGAAEKRRTTALAREMPLEAHPARCAPADFSPRAILARAQYKCKHTILPLPGAPAPAQVPAPDVRRTRARYRRERDEKHEVLVRARERFVQTVPAFGPLTRVLSPVVSRAQWEIVIRSAFLALLISIAVVGTLCAVPVR